MAKAKKRKEIKKRLLLVAHGDFDGIVSAVLASWRHPLEDVRVAFVQPFTVDKVEVADDEDVIVVDVAVNNRDSKMTTDFISRLGGRLYRWFDHHQGWESLKIDDRLVINSDAPSCAQVVMSSSQDGDMEYYFGTLVADATAADTRQGQLSSEADLIERATKANLSDDSVREAAFRWLLGDKSKLSVLEAAAEKYAAIQAETERLSATYRVTGNVAVVDARESEHNYDRTQLLLAGQKVAPFAVVVSANPRAGEDYLTIATSRKDVNLVEIFGLPSGAPFRVSIPASRLEEALGKLNSL